MSIDSIDTFNQYLKNTWISNHKSDKKFIKNSIKDYAVFKHFNVHEDTFQQGNQKAFELAKILQQNSSQLFIILPLIIFLLFQLYVCSKSTILPYLAVKLSDYLILLPLLPKKLLSRIKNSHCTNLIIKITPFYFKISINWIPNKNYTNMKIMLSSFYFYQLQ